MTRTVLATIPLLLVLLAACSTTQPPCKQLSSDSEVALNIIMIQDGFNEDRFDNLTAYVKDTVLEKEPFASNPRINFYTIGNDNDSICVPGTPRPLIGGYAASPLPPLNCDVTHIKTLVNSCGVEKAKIIILTEDTVASQTGISFDESAVMFLDMKNQPPEIIQHEIAHLFGLVDEHAKLVSFEDGPGRRPAPNCLPTAMQAHMQWSSFYPENHTFPQGCAGERDWFKPQEDTLLARFPDTKKEYGVFATWYLNTTLLCCYSAHPDPDTCAAFIATYPQWESCAQ